MSARSQGWSEILEGLTRFDRPGPRYTSYPTAVEFHEGVSDASYEAALDEANRDRAGAPISFYAHLPFCGHRCLFCGCNVVITPHMPVAKRYLEYLLREIDMVAERLPDRRDIVQMHWGGGTPTYYDSADIQRLFGKIREHFDFPEGAEIAIEVDPRVTSEEHLATLSELGFNRLSMGVQDLTPAVQEAITRNQTFEQTAALIERARALGFSEGINVDLIYGLPRQELDSFGEGIDQVIGLRPDRVALYSFAYVPWIKGHQKKIDPGLLPPPEEKLQLYLEGMRRFLEAGYVPIGMDHFALPGDELAVAASEERLYRNFMGYSVMPAPDMVATGISGIGEVGAGYYQNHKKLSTYYESLDAGRLPLERGYELDRDDGIRQHVIREIMCNFRVDFADVEQRFSIDFGEYFSAELEALGELRDAGFVIVRDREVRVTEPGRVFVRNVCMEFDGYLERPKPDLPIFSRTV